MTFKDTYILRVWDTAAPQIVGTGEVALFAGLSAEDEPGFETKLNTVANDIDHYVAFSPNEKKYKLVTTTLCSSLYFGLETVVANLNMAVAAGKTTSKIFPSSFTSGKTSIPINGLVWMGRYEEMLERIDRKLAEGFDVIKIKIGGIDFDEEVKLLDYIRGRWGSDKVTLRLDANCSFSRYSFNEAMHKLKILAEYGIHSIEQPFAVGDISLTRRAVSSGVIPIALDEQLIGVTDNRSKRRLLEEIAPQYIVLKPSLCGGFEHTSAWIAAAREMGIGWWITSALESAIGLNAIAQYVGVLADTFSCNKLMPQGLGTGELYMNDFPASVLRQGPLLYFNG